MDHQNKGAHTPNRFLSVRGQRTTSSAASSAESSPHFLSWRQATTPSRPSVAGPAKSLATDLSGGARLPQYWPSFGDAVRQKEADDVVFGIRKRTTAARATVIDGRPMTLVTRPTSLARRLLSEPGATGAVSPSAAPTTEAATGQARPGKPTRLSPTALDWAPRANALSLRLSSLSYADVARIGDRRPPPPPFPILRKPRSPRASLASTGTIVRPGASSSNTTGSSNDSEMDDGHDSDKESKTTTLEMEATKTAETTQADEFTELAVRITTSDDCETRDTSPSCHGLGNALGDGLGLLGKSADENLTIGTSDDLLVNRHAANAVFMSADGGCGSRPKCPVNMSAHKVTPTLRPHLRTQPFPTQQKYLQYRAPTHVLANHAPARARCTPPRITPTRHRPLTNTPTRSAAATARTTPSSHGQRAPNSPGPVLAAMKFAELHHNAQRYGWGASPFLPKTDVEYEQLIQELRDRQKCHQEAKRWQAVVMQQEADTEQQGAMTVQGRASQPTQPKSARQFHGGRDVLEGQARLGAASTMQPSFQPTDGSTTVLGVHTTFSDRLVPYEPDKGLFYSEWHFAPWPTTDEFCCAGRVSPHRFPWPHGPVPSGTTSLRGGNQGNGGQYYEPEIYIQNRWDWIPPHEIVGLVNEPSVEIEVADVNGQLQNLIANIDKLLT